MGVNDDVGCVDHHTPEPWLAQGQEVVAPDYGGQSGLDMTIARVHFAGTMAGEEGRANARLIAAAPELLSLLRSLLDDQPDAGGGEGDIAVKAWALIEGLEPRKAVQS